MVMTTTEMVLRVAGERAVTPTPLTSQSTSRSEKLSAAKALARKPAMVMPIWMVDKKRLLCWFILRISFAFLSPSSAWRRMRFSLTEITAISVAAKNAFTRIKMTCSSS